MWLFKHKCVQEQYVELQPSSNIQCWEADVLTLVKKYKLYGNGNTDCKVMDKKSSEIPAIVQSFFKTFFFNKTHPTMQKRLEKANRFWHHFKENA